MSKHRLPQEYSPEEFDTVVAMIQADASLRQDIEAITGQKLDGKTPRQLFDLFRSIERTTAVQVAVVNYGRARAAVRQTRAELAQLPPADLPPDTARYVQQLQDKVTEERNRRIQAEAALKARRNVVQLPAGESRKAVNG